MDALCRRGCGHQHAGCRGHSPSGRTFDYEFGGVTLQAQAGITYQISERLSVFGEYKGNYSFVDVPIDSGARLKTDIITNAVNLGVSFHF